MKNYKILMSEIKNALKTIHESSALHDKRVLLSKIDLILNDEPDNLDALCAKAIFFIKTKDPAKGLEVCRQIQKIAPANPVVKSLYSQLNEMNDDCTAREKDKTSKTLGSLFEFNVLKNISFSNLLIIKLVVLLITIVYCYDFYFLSENDRRILKLSAVENRTKPVNAKKFTSIPLNQTSDFKYLSKKQIYDIRKKYVKNSFFAKSDYEPSNDVFGSLEDNKPWWGELSCNREVNDGNYDFHIEGKSRVSAQINNPDALVGITMAFIMTFNDEISDFCTSKYSKFYPVSLEFDKKDRLFIASYKVKRSFIDIFLIDNGKKTRFPLQLSGLNARDFGYRYVYAFDLKNIKMYKPESVYKKIKTFDDFLHTGGSCRIEGGCNNVSPTQFDKMFTLVGLPAEINLKLWKTAPKSEYQKADIYYKIIFEE